MVVCVNRVEGEIPADVSLGGRTDDELVGVRSDGREVFAIP